MKNIFFFFKSEQNIEFGDSSYSRTEISRCSEMKNDIGSNQKASFITNSMNIVLLNCVVFTKMSNKIILTMRAAVHMGVIKIDGRY